MRVNVVIPSSLAPVRVNVLFPSPYPGVIPVSLLVDVAGSLCNGAFCSGIIGLFSAVSRFTVGLVLPLPSRFPVGRC